MQETKFAKTFLARLDKFVQDNFVETPRQKKICENIMMSRVKAESAAGPKGKTSGHEDASVSDLADLKLSKVAELEIPEEKETLAALENTGYAEARAKANMAKKSALTRHSIEELLQLLGDTKKKTFVTLMVKFMQQKKLEPVDVYKGACLDRKHFSKILSNAYYHPRKRTALALCLGLRLTRDEALTLLQSAGYTFSPAIKGDLVVEFCFREGTYNIFDVDALLEKYQQPLLGKYA